MTASVPRLARFGPPIAWLSAAVIVVAAAGMVLLVGRNGVAFDDSVVGFALPFLSLAVVGAVVAARRPELPLGWLLLVPAGSIMGYAFLEQYATYALVTRPGSLPGGHLTAWVRVSMWVPGAVAINVLLPLLFPTGSPPSPRWRPVGWVAAISGAVMIALRQVAAWPFAGVDLVAPGDAWVRDAPLAQFADRLFLVLLLCGVLALASLVVRFRRSTGTERLQLRWVMYGFGAFLVLFVLSMAFHGKAPADVLPAVGIVAVAVSIGISVLRYRLYDIDRLVARTVSYGVVTVAVVGIYLGAVVTATAAVPSAGDSDIVVALSTLGAAAAFRPIRRRVQTVVDRRFHRSHYDAERLVTAFSSRLRDQVDLATVARELVATSAGSLRPSSISLWTGASTDSGNGSGTLPTYNSP